MKKHLNIFSLADLYGEWNRRRGSGYKYPAYCIFTGSFLLYLAPLLGEMSWTKFAVIAIADFFKNILIFQVIGWGKYFPHSRPTYNESEFFLADWYANLRMGDKYTIDSSVSFAVDWKTHAMTFRLCFMALLGFSLLGYAVGSVAVALTGLLFMFAGEMYKEEFEVRESGAVARAERRVGEMYGWAMTFVLVVIYLEAIYKLWWRV